MGDGGLFKIPSVTANMEHFVISPSSVFDCAHVFCYVKPFELHRDLTWSMKSGAIGRNVEHTGGGPPVNSSEFFLHGVGVGCGLVFCVALAVQRARWFRLPLSLVRVRRWFWSSARAVVSFVHIVGSRLVLVVPRSR